VPSSEQTGAADYAVVSQTIVLSEGELRRLRTVWEHRLPDLGGEWTHWWLEGDGRLLGVLPGDDLVAALELVADKCRHHESIFAYRANVGVDGEVQRQQNLRFAISDRRKDGIAKPIGPDRAV
jgi:hypothetical protein